MREMGRARLQMEGPPGAEFVLRVSERIEGDLVGGMTYHAETLSTIYLPLVVKNH